MSQADVARFAELLTSDAELMQKVQAEVSRKLSAIAQLAASNGYEFTPDEYGQFLNATFLAERTDPVCRLLQRCLEIESVDQTETPEFKTVVLDNETDLMNQLRAKADLVDQDASEPVDTAAAQSSAWDAADSAAQEDAWTPPAKPWWRFW